MVFNNNLLLGAAGQGGGANFDTTLIGNSVWLDGSADLFTKSSFAGNASKKVISVWVQRTGFSSFGLIRGTNSSSDRVGFGDNVLNNQVYVVVNGKNLYSNQSFRDIGWYHYLVSFDLTQSIASNKVKVYINSVDIDASGGWQVDERSTMSSSFGSFNSASVAQQIGRDGASSMYLNAYLAQYCELDGQSIQSGDVATTDFYDTFTFGTNGSQIIPKKNSDIAALATTAGSNSFCLDFADSSDLGNDISSNNNDFTPTSMDSSNQTVHTPSLQFPVLNALNGDATLVGSLGYGNRLAVGVSDWDSVFATKSMGSSGKYYYEVRMHTETASNGFIAGIHEESTTSKNWASYIGNTTSTYGLGYSLYTDSGSAIRTNGGSSTISGYSGTIAAGDIVMVAVDLDNNKLYFGRNGTFFNSGDPANGTGESVAIQADTEYVFGLSTSASEDYFVNFGQDSTFGGATTAGGNTDANGVGDFKYTVPTGFQCLASSSLTAPDFQGIDYFDATLYEGNGQNQRVGDFVPFTDTYTVDKSAMFDDGDRRYLARTYSASDTARSGTTSTISYWIKYCKSSSSQYVLSTSNSGQTERFIILIDSSGNSQLILDPPGSGNNRQFVIPGGFLSEQEWTNFVWQVDPGNATAADKVKAWVNGVQITSTDTSYQSASASDYYLFDNEEHFVGNLAPASAGYTGFSLNSYLAELNVLDGQLKAPTDFGQVDTSTNRWVPKDYKTNVGAYGNRGFYMAFDNASGTGNGVGTDSSGNGFNFTESFVSGGSAWATTDQFTDTPSKNFDNLGGASSGSPTISEGHTLATFAAGGKQIRSNFNLNAGKWYVESDIQATNNSASIGLVPSRSATFSNGPGRDANGGISYETDGDVFSDNVQNATAEASFAAGDVVQMAIDMDAKKVYFGKNNTFGGDPAAGTGGHSLPASILSDGAALITLGNYSGSQSSTQQINYGQFLVFDGGSTTNGFKYTPPTGFQAVNQDNLDDTASKITAWSWIKNRDAADSHILVDRVRGVGEVIHSNETAAEATEFNTVQRFLQRGVQVGNDVQVNTANESYVLWQWLLGDSATTGSTNSNGSLDTSVIAADADHFSIVSWTMSDPAAAKTLGHGLTAAPELIIVKNRTDASTNWPVYSEIAGNTKYQYLSTTAAAATFNMWQNTSPTSTVFSVSSNNEASGSANDQMIAYCFRSVPGVCKVGSYEGNGSTDGTYVSLGFKPAFVLFKSVDSTSDWQIFDKNRNGFNVRNNELEANDTAVEDTSTNFLDLLSDGFKMRIASDPNVSETFLYLAMAEIGGNGTLPPVYGR